MTRPWYAGLLALTYLCCMGPASAADRAAEAYLAGDLDKAESMLEAEIGKSEARPSRYLLLARIQFRQKDWEATRRTVAALIEKDPENPNALELQGRVLLRLDRFEEALPYLEKTVRETNRSELRIEYAEALIGIGRDTEAVSALKKVIKDKQTWPRAHFLLGKLRLESGIGHWATQQLWIAHRLQYDAKELDYLLAQAFYLEGRATGPLRLAGPFDEVQTGQRTEDHIKIAPAGADRPGFWYVSGADTAIYQVESAIEKADKVSDDMLLLAARCWLAAGDPDRAGQHVTKIRKKSSESLPLQGRIALLNDDLPAFSKLTDKMKGIVSAENIVRQRLEAALAAQVQGQPEEAHRFLKKADELIPGRSDVLRSMVDVLTQLDRSEEAQQKARLLIELHPDSPEARLLAGRHGVREGDDR